MMKRLVILALSVFIVGTLSVGYGGGCKTGGGLPAAGSGSSSSNFLTCEGTNLLQLVGPSGLTLIAQVSADLASGNYLQLVADLISTLGANAVGCAILAIEGAESASPAGSGSAAVPATANVKLSRARELITKYGWQAK